MLDDMLDDYNKQEMRDILKQIDEGCAGGVCSVGGSSDKSSKGGGGTKISSLNSTVARLDSWQNPNKDNPPDDEKQNVLPEEPDTIYKDTPEGEAFTAEEEYEEDWTQKELKFENEIRTDDELNKAQDLKERYQQMIAPEPAQPYPVEEPPEADMAAPMHPTDDMMGTDDPAHQAASEFAAADFTNSLKTVTDHFEAQGEPYEVMVKVGETSKSVQEWESEINRDASEELPPEVPEIPPTEGGYDGEHSTDVEDNTDIPFPEFDTPDL